MNTKEHLTHLPQKAREYFTPKRNTALFLIGFSLLNGCEWAGCGKKEVDKPATKSDIAQLNIKIDTLTSTQQDKVITGIETIKIQNEQVQGTVNEIKTESETHGQHLQRIDGSTQRIEPKVNEIHTVVKDTNQRVRKIQDCLDCEDGTVKPKPAKVEKEATSIPQVETLKKEEPKITPLQAQQKPIPPPTQQPVTEITPPPIIVVEKPPIVETPVIQAIPQVEKIKEQKENCCDEPYELPSDQTLRKELLKLGIFSDKGCAPNSYAVWETLGASYLNIPAHQVPGYGYISTGEITLSIRGVAQSFPIPNPALGEVNHILIKGNPQRNITIKCTYPEGTAGNAVAAHARSGPIDLTWYMSQVSQARLPPNSGTTADDGANTINLYYIDLTTLKQTQWKIPTGKK